VILRNGRHETSGWRGDRHHDGALRPDEPAAAIGLGRTAFYERVCRTCESSTSAESG
jgi:hypothetical protein